MTEVSERTSSGEEDQMLSRLAVKNQFVSEQQIQEALMFQKQETERGRKKSLGDALLEKGMISRKQLDYLQVSSNFLTLRQADAVFARIVVKNHLATQEQVDRALQAQAKMFKDTKSFTSLGDIFVQAGTLSAQKRDAIQVMLARMKKEKGGVVADEHKPTPPPATHPASPAKPGPEAVKPSASESEALEDIKISTGRVLTQEDCFDLVVTEDALSVYLRVTKDIPDSVTAETIKTSLKSKGVVYGIVDDSLVDGYLRLKGAHFRPLRIADGVPAKSGRDAEIKHYFDARRLAVDLTGQNAPIDLKNRGLIPQVKQGDLLAEKYPRTPEVPGIDVFGKKIAVASSKDVRFQIGTGVQLSEDGLKIYAKTDGRPELSVFGKLSVLPELVVEGDVSYETGNLAFDGIIHVRGAVQDGFHVKGRMLTAQEIGKAEIDIGGDVTVSGGILGATLKCQGNLRAVHIHASRIEAQGSVVVDKGIFDSRISTSGKCAAEKGKIISSKIIAKMGVEADYVGSDLSVPSTLIVGMDAVTERRVEALKASVVQKEQEKSRVRVVIETLNDQSLQAELRIGELAQIQDRGALQKRSIQEKLKEVNKEKDKEKTAKLEGMIADLDQKLKSAEDELNKLFDRQDQIRDTIAGHSEKIKEIDKEIQDIHDEIVVITEWIREHPGFAGVRVLHTAHAGTIIRGPFATLTLESDARSALIREVLETEPSEGTASCRWKMQIQSAY